MLRALPDGFEIDDDPDRLDVADVFVLPEARGLLPAEPTRG